MEAKELVVAALDRSVGTIKRATEGLRDAELLFQPTPECNSIAWLIWHLSRWKDRCAALERWQHEAIEQAMRSLAEDLNMKAGDLFMLLRVACAGRPISPPLFESMEVLGKERCLDRIEAAAALLKS